MICKCGEEMDELARGSFDLPHKLYQCRQRRWWNSWRHTPDKLDLLNLAERSVKRTIAHAREDALINGDT